MNVSSELSKQPREVIVQGPGEGEAVWFLNHFITVKVRSKDGAPFGLVENAMGAGEGTPFHRHLHEDEAFYVLEGEITVFLEGRRVVRGRAGTYLHIPRGVAHGFRADTQMRMLVLSDPAGFVEFTREAGIAAPRRELPPAIEPDMPRLMAIAKRYGIEILGPLPG